MTAPSGQGAAQVGRWTRLTLFASVMGPIVAAVFHAALLRYPALGAAVGALEVIYRSAFPVQSTPVVTAVPAAAHEAGPATAPPYAPPPGT